MRMRKTSLPRPFRGRLPRRFHTPHFHVVARNCTRRVPRRSVLNAHPSSAFPKTFRDPPGASNQSFINMTSVDFIIAVPLLQLEFFGTAASSEAAVYRMPFTRRTCCSSAGATR